MPVKVAGQTYYRTSEACQMIGISRATLLRWLKRDNLPIKECRDRRSWRLFTKTDIIKLNEEANRIVEEK